MAKKPAVQSGLEVLRGSRFEILRGAKVGLLVHPASVDSELRHAVDVSLASKQVKLVRLFGPQHGIRGETQDNMIEWEDFRDQRSGLPVCSLYGKTRRPEPRSLAGLDALVIDLQDAGARVYTFIWTMLLCMRACAEAGVRVVVLDRPNPVGGRVSEGPVLDPEYASFVGMLPIPVRHGMTIGELAVLFNEHFKTGCRLDVVWMKGYRRCMWFDQTGLPWVFPSPNLPTLNSAVVFPGFHWFEGTELSEGRGTTRPFELFGAPYIDPDALVEKLAKHRLPGVRFRPVYFEPAFQKHAGKCCGGVQLHVSDREIFRSVHAAAAALAAVRGLYPTEFAWKQPPYEYEEKKMPIDILSGSDALRKDIDAGRSAKDIAASWKKPLKDFEKLRAKFLHYK